MIQIILGLAVVLVVVLVGFSLPLLVGAGALVLLWRVSLVVWPDKRCSSCQGMGARSGPLHWQRGCGECQGSGRVRRMGAKE